MLVRTKNPLRNLTRNQKIGIGVGVGAALAITTIAVVAAASDKEAPRNALTINDGCASYTINNVQKIEDDLRESVRKAAKKGPVDPLTITQVYIRKAGPKCTTYPGRADAVQVKLFAAIYMTLLAVMQQEGMLTDNDFVMWHNMMLTWAAGQGVSAEELK